MLTRLARPRSALLLSTLPLLSLLAVSCGDDAAFELSVDVKTDFDPRSEFASIRVEVSDVSDPAGSWDSAEDTANVRGANYARGVRVFEHSYDGERTLRARVSLLDARGAIVVRRLHVVELRDSLALTVVLTRDCRNITCPSPGAPASATECLAGMCVSPECSEDHPELCPPPECTGDSTCGAVVACAVGRCVSGACLSEPDDSRCAAGQRCSLDRGCVAEDEDAGTTTDAGTDAGLGIDASMDAGIGVDAGTDTGTDAGTDAGTDTGTDMGTDTGTDAGTDAGTDTGTDAGADAGPGIDGGFDSGFDAGLDAGIDAGFDAGRDAGRDAGLDGGPDPSFDAATCTPTSHFVRTMLAGGTWRSVSNTCLAARMDGADVIVATCAFDTSEVRAARLRVSDFAELTPRILYTGTRNITYLNVAANGPVGNDVAASWFEFPSSAYFGIFDADLNETLAPVYIGELGRLSRMDRADNVFGVARDEFHRLGTGGAELGPPTELASGSWGGAGALHYDGASFVSVHVEDRNMLDFNYDLYFRRFMPNGAQIGSEVRLTTTAVDEDTVRPAIASTGSGYLASWTYTGPGVTNRVDARFLTSTGSAATADFALTDGTRRFFGHDLRVVRAGTRTAVVFNCDRTTAVGTCVAWISDGSTTAERVDFVSDCRTYGNNVDAVWTGSKLLIFWDNPLGIRYTELDP